MNAGNILERATGGDRLSEPEALHLLQAAELPDLAEAADRVRKRLNPAPVVTYIVDRNINYSNVCTTGCRFCAFHRPSGHPEAYVLTRETLERKVKATVENGGVQILLQGGHHPELPLEWYEETLRALKRFPVHLHAFSPPEIDHLARLFKMSLPDLLERLRDAGLDSIPGGGAEILVDRVRREVSPGKTSADRWIDVMREAHRIGMKTSATMMFGHVETPEERIEHLRRLRTLQDESLERGNGGGFTAFICWTFQPGNTRLAHLPKCVGAPYLRMLATARLYLDNFPHLQASWVTQGEKIAQLALLHGADDMGSTMMEENVVAEAGVSFRLPESRIRKLISDLGLAPRRRKMDYRPLES